MTKIPKINDRDEIIGETTITEARANGWPRRISRVFVFDESGNMLLQKRGSRMHSYPGLWDQAVGGHVDLGESYEAAALREMREELGIEADVEEIITSYWLGNDSRTATYNAIYRTVVDRQAPLLTDPEEVETVAWMSVEDFESNFNAKPEEYVPGFIHCWQHFRAKLLA